MSYLTIALGILALFWMPTFLAPFGLLYLAAHYVFGGRSLP